MSDFILNGQGNGNVAATLLNANFDLGALRPFRGRDGQSYITVNTGHTDDKGTPVTRNLVTNAPTALRKDDWVHLDTAVIKAARPRLNAVADLRQAGLVYNIPNGLGKTIYEYEAQSTFGSAVISMDGIRQSDNSRPQFDLRSLPLPIIHQDFSYSARQVIASRNGGSPLDVTAAEEAARNVAEEAEKLVLGVSSAYTFGGGTVYGYTNYTYRETKSLTQPTTSNQATTVNEVLDMRKKSMDNNYYGPWILYYSPAWSVFMDGDYSSAKGDNTLRERLAKIEGITAVKQADYLTGTTLVMVQQTSDVVQLVMGMDITTVQWESLGGMQLNFKVMAIMVPLLRHDYNTASGIIHGKV
jgi:uncharacterized linocin/CFP29 family protein